ncbi:hypothetical protein HMI55_006039, partial [Coelomomyces lativittatus]
MKRVISNTPLSMIAQLCTLFEAQYKELKKPASAKTLEAIFIQSIVWSIGSLIIERHRIQFCECIKKLGELTLINAGGTVNVGELPGTDKSLYDYKFDIEDNQWKPWSRYVEPYQHDRNLAFHQILVPTTDTQRYIWLLEKVVSLKKPVLFVGDVGTSKTVT